MGTPTGAFETPIDAKRYMEVLMLYEIVGNIFFRTRDLLCFTIATIV